jgi:AcrR family transcriptional regulator
MSTRTRDGQERKPTEVRQREIVDVAIRIIAIEGSRRFTAKNIATEVGITSGAIFRHFDSMGSIVDAAVERVGAVLLGDFPPQDPDPIERLKVFFFNRTRTVLANPHISRLLLSDHLRQAASPAQVQRMEAFKKRSRTFVVGCLQEAEQSGALSEGISTEVGAVMVLGVIHSLSHASTRVVRETKVEVLSHEVWSAIEHMLRATTPSGEPTKQPERRQRRRAKGKE